MSPRRTRITLVITAAMLGLPALAACRGLGASDPHDPCTLMTGTEATHFVGSLATPPYRASDGTPDARGDECIYRGRDGRQIAVQPAWSGGAAAGKVLEDVPNTVGGGLAKKGATGLDTMAHRVMKTEVTGPWDHATWIPGGSLIATKGDASVAVDVSAASGLESDAVAIGRIVMPRFGHPLDYDGAKAVALVPKPPAHPARACDFIPRATVEAAIGPLAGAPTSTDPETSCTYRVNTPQGERVYAVEFVWQNGQKNFSMLKHSMATVSGVMGTPASSPLDTMKMPPQMQAMMGGMMKMVGGASAEGKAPGATSTMGFRTDTALVGPWDGAALLHGSQLIAVRHDVFVGMTLESADYEKAKALLTAICTHL